MFHRKLFDSLEECLNKHIPAEELKEVKRILYGQEQEKELKLSSETLVIAEINDFEVKAFGIAAEMEHLRKPRVVRIAAVQNRIMAKTTDPVDVQRNELHKRIGIFIQAAAASHVNILCLPETWTMPFAFGLQEKQPWCEFAENAETGNTTNFLKELAQQYNMVIISPILERDENHGDVMWNTAVVISNAGNYLGKHRKNHIPLVDDINESSYFNEGNTGHPVFETQFGKIAINVCYGRHHPQNWMMFGINGAEIVFNPTANTGAMSESLWMIEARNAAIANSYFTVTVNRVGTEKFSPEFKSCDKNAQENVFGPYYGSSYVAAPDGSRTPGLSRNRDGLLIVEMDLNLCRQVRDHWGFQLTQRLPLYAESFTAATKFDFKPQIIREILN